jgi:sugar lactone lactonase YvrE/4-amino-4-deoxy-L-arabinose transferase-like glycosyltransferase
VLAVDALFGLLLLAVAFGSGRPPATSPSVEGATSSPAMQLTARLGGVIPPGQSTGFARDADGSLAIVDRTRQVVIRLDADGQPRGEWGPHFGLGLDARDLLGVAPDGDGWYLLDRGAQRILRLTGQGAAQAERTIDLSSLATYGPTALATDARGNLFMADTGRDRVVVFDSNGRLSGEFGESGTNLGQLKQPMALSFGPDGSLFVSDWENSRVQRWDAERHPSDAWPLPLHAWGMTVDRLGRVFVPDGEHQLVRVFRPDGTLLAQLGGDGGPPIPVDSPSQVVASPDGSTLWVLGADGLARVDLSRFAALRVDADATWSRLPLAAPGAVLLAIAAVGAVWPKRHRILAPTPASAARALATPIGFLLIAVGVVGAMAAEIQLADPLARADPWPKLGGLLAASACFAVGCSLTARDQPWRWVAMTLPPRGATVRLATRRSVGATSALVVLTLAAVAAQIWWHGRFQTPDATRGALLWLLAVILTVGTLAYYGRPGLKLKQPSWPALVPWLLLGLALVPRVYNNADLPYGVWFDEAQAGLQARKFLQTGVFTPITDTYGRDAALQYYLIAAAQALIPDPVLAGRLVSAVLGALCAPLLYLLGRELFGWRVGLAAGALVAMSRWHLDVSRLGWDPISLPLCASLAFWLLARAIRTERWTDAAWAGLALGLGLHGYIGYRALPVVGFGVLLYAAWRRHWSVRGTAVRLALMVGGAVLAALPVIVFAIQDPTGFNGRVNQTSILNQSIAQSDKFDQLWSNLQKHALMFHVSGDLNGRHNLPGAPMLDPLSGLLLVLGLAVLLGRPFDWRSLLLLGWAAVSMAGGIFTLAFEAPQAMRTLGVTPVLALTVGLALVLLLDRVRPRPAPRLLAAVGVILVAWIGVTNVSTFFDRQMHDPLVWEAFSTRETLPARLALAAEQPYEALLGSPTIAPSLQQQLLLPAALQRTIRAFDPPADLPYRGSGPSLFVLESEHDAGLANEVARYYPAARRTAIVPPNGSRPTAETILLERATLDAQRGVQATYRGSDRATVERREPDPFLIAEQVPVALPAEIAWRAALALDQPGRYGLQVSNGFHLNVDGADVGDTAQLQLARGNHLLTVSGSLAQGGRLDLQWQSPAEPDVWLPLDPALLFIAPAGGSGLEATFYPTRDFQGSPGESIIDPILNHYYHLNPLRRLNLSPVTWSAEWRGVLDVPASGAYRFDAERLSRAGLWIDEQRVFDDTADGAAVSNSGVVQLGQGRHAIRVRLQSLREGGPRLYLYWTLPGGSREVVPGERLYPPPPAVWAQ